MNKHSFSFNLLYLGECRYRILYNFYLLFFNDGLIQMTLSFYIFFWALFTNWKAVNFPILRVSFSQKHKITLLFLGVAFFHFLCLRCVLKLVTLNSISLQFFWVKGIIILLLFSLYPNWLSSPSKGGAFFAESPIFITLKKTGWVLGSGIYYVREF